MTMRTTLVAAATLAALVCAGAAPRASSAVAQCPVVEVKSAADVVKTGEPAGFEVGITPAPAGAPLTFAWEVSGGTVAEGQGTRRIVVDTTGLGDQTVRAAVTVGGLAAGCPNGASAEMIVARPFAPHPLDSYGPIPFEHEKARLDNFVIMLLDLPKMQGFMQCYGGRRGRRGEALARCARAKNYLVRRRGLDPQRLTLLDAGFREDPMFVLWVLPADVRPPPLPTIAPEEVEFVNPPRRARRARRRH